MMSKSEPRRKPMGVPLDWSDDDLDRLSQITPEDVERAKVGWRQHAPKRFKPLLDAEPDDERR